MESLFTTANIMFGLGILGVIFGVYKYFRDPQVNSDKRDALLAQQVQWQVEGTEKRFTEIQCNFKDLLTLNTNHLHTVQEKLENLTIRVNTINVSLEKLATVIEERIPKK